MSACIDVVNDKTMHFPVLLLRPSSLVRRVAFSATSAQVSTNFVRSLTLGRFLESAHVSFIGRVE